MPAYLYVFLKFNAFGLSVAV